MPAPTKRWPTRCFLHLIVALVVPSSAVSIALFDQQLLLADSDDRANIIVIIADDLGYGETGMMGHAEIPTPNIDALAAGGVRCTAGYVTSSLCSPSRAGIMTGRYQSRFGYDWNPTGKKNLLPSAGLPASETTFVRRLADAGYKTGLVGKWHLGATSEKHPLRHGFDSFYGFLHEGHYYVPGPPYQNVLTMLRDTRIEKGKKVREDNLIRGNYARISEPAYDDDNPLLSEEKEIVEADYLTDAITNRAIKFVTESAQEPFCLVVSYNAVHSPMQAKNSDVETLRRIKNVQRRIFAGMLVALDRGVGRLQDTLDEQDLTRKTLVVFLSDNGGPTQELTSSNLPLRGEKGSLYEGGIRIPMVWSMPGRLPTGKVEDRAVLSLDIAATALDLAGLPADERADGKSLLNWINNPPHEGIHDGIHDKLYWRMTRGRMALQMGDWKIVRQKSGSEIELYNVTDDPSESRDLAGEHPERLKHMIDEWETMDSEMATPVKD